MCEKPPDTGCGNCEHAAADAHAVLEVVLRLERVLKKYLPLIDALTNGGRGVTLASMRRFRQ